jgi:membrane protease YdiL (CAAX protease family)
MPTGPKREEPTSKVKNYQRLLIIIIASLVLSALITPFVFYGIQALRALSPGLDGALDFPFDRVMRRVILIVTLLLLFLERRRLEIRSLAAIGLKKRAGWKRQLSWGWITGVLSLSCMLVIMLAPGSRRFSPDFTGPFNLVYELGKAFVSGAVVALIEEVFFRGFILQSLMKDLRKGAAVVAASLFFAIVHFFNAGDMPALAGLDVTAGFRALVYFFQPLLAPSEVIPGFIGLFLVGIVLACAYIWTGSLYLSIGLHAGWVFAIKGESVFLSRAGRVAPWFYGGGEVVTGVFGWIMLAVVLIILRLFVRPPAPPPSPPPKAS